MNAIWKDGFEQSSVKNLSELLGMTRSSFYNAFGSREALFRETIPEYAAQAPDAPLYVDTPVDVPTLLTLVFRDLCHARAADPEGRGCMIINTVSELCPDSEGLGAELTELLLGSGQRLQSLLQAARDNGDLPASADPHALALAVQNLQVGINVFCKVVRSEDELWLLARTTLEGLGLYRDPGQPVEAAASAT